MPAFIKSLCLFGTVFLTLSTSFGAIKPTITEASRDGEYTYFRVELPLPSDNVPTENIYPLRASGPPPRYPMLYSLPVHITPCYMETRQADGWGPIETTNVFYGRTTATESLQLKLRYPKTKGDWGLTDVEVVLSSADSLTSRTFANSSGDGSANLSPAQQFARAKVANFALQKMQVPDDAGFFDYAIAQVSRTAGLDMPTQFGFSQTARAGDSPRDRLYETATGARAIQETLQVDRMLGSSQTTQPRTLDIEKLEGVQTKSHPFEEMLRGKTSKFSDVAKVVPADQYMLQFKSTDKLVALGQFAQKWGGAVLQSPEVGGANTGLRQKVQTQVCLPDEALRKLSPALLKEVVVTGSAPYFREGTDITFIFDAVSPAELKAALNSFWSPGSSSLSVDAGTTTIEGAETDYIVTGDSRVRAYRAVVDNLVLYSNSPVALGRILKTKGQPAESMAESLDFQYMRAVWRQDASDEDGFLFLSDAFVRQLVGPHSKIKEKRRLEAFSSMRMIMNAAMLHGYDYGSGKTPTLEELFSKKLLFRSDIELPDDEIRWDAESASASSAIYGKPHFLTPLCEIPISKISESESEEYVRFRDRYQQYWRQFFDPVGVRIKLDQTLKVDAYILPLIDESAYRELKALTGETPAEFDLSTVSTGTLVRWQVRLDPQAEQIRNIKQMAGGMMGRDSAMMEWIGEWATVWVEDAEVSAELFASSIAPALGEELEEETTQTLDLSFFKIPVAAGIAVTNKLSLAGFLIALNGIASSAAPDLVQFVPQAPYKGVTMVKVMPKPGGRLDQGLAQDRQTTIGDVGIYYASIGDGWYISTQDSVLKRLIDASEPGGAAKPRVIKYNGLLLVSPGNVIKARPVVEKGSRLLMRKLERDKLYQAWLLYRCGLVDGEDSLTSAAVKWFGGPVAPLSGSTITFDETGNQPVSSVYGPLFSMKVADAIAGTNPILQLFESIAHIRAWLQFTEDGLATSLELEQAVSR